MMDNPQVDALLSLRRSIASNKPPIPTSSSKPTALSDAIENLAIATHLQFNEPEHLSFPLDTPTRFISSENPVDLRSIYFAWQKKDVAIPDYIASAQQLNEELSGADGAGGKVQNLVFVERLDLITWLEGASEESEYIKALDSEAAIAKSNQVASSAGATSAVPSSAAGVRVAKTIDPRLQEIYNGERRMGDRNTILRGIKPTVSPRLFPTPPHQLTLLGFFPRPQISRDISRSKPPPAQLHHSTIIIIIKPHLSRLPP